MPRANIGHALLTADAQHAGLWLDKYLRKPPVKSNKDEQQRNEQPRNEESRQDHVRETTQIREPTFYKLFFEDWKHALASVGARTDTFARTLGRLAIGLGNESVIETSISLHRTYGVPYIPGSALKGLAAHYAHSHLGPEWKKGTEAYKVVFGYSDKPVEPGTLNADAGFITFFDALYVPGSGKQGQALHPDVITVHHPNYYNKENPEAPADWDSPTPIPFLTTNGIFLLALAGPSKEWLNTTYNILAHALLEWGIGAKTSSGYGRMAVTGYDPLLEAMLAKASEKKQAKVASGQPFAPQPPPLDPEQAAADKLIKDIQDLPLTKVANEIGQYVDRWRKLQARINVKQQVASEIIAKVRDAGREKTSREKSWYQELLASLQ